LGYVADQESDWWRAAIGSWPVQQPETAVLVPIGEWRQAATRSFKEWLLVPEPRFDDLVPPRQPRKMRLPPTFED
jgi:hypothetical protein